MISPPGAVTEAEQGNIDTNTARRTWPACGNTWSLFDHNMVLSPWLDLPMIPFGHDFGTSFWLLAQTTDSWVSVPARAIFLSSLK